MRALFFIADLCYLIMYRMAGYRRQITWDNLKNAYPSKSDKELQIIMDQFYRNFFDQWFEFLKLLTISKDELNKRIRGNWELFRQLDQQEKNTYALLGHTFNWEWASVACQYNAPQQFAGVYMPVESGALNRLISRLRTRGGGWLISMKAKKGFQRLNGVRYIVGLIADQNPSNLNGAIWLPFMHRQAPFFKGPEQLARRAKAAVVFAGIKRLERGHYEVQLTFITSDASQLTEGELTRMYVSFMEQQLLEQPANWLWTHKRWKHTAPAALVQ